MDTPLDWILWPIIGGLAVWFFVAMGWAIYQDIRNWVRKRSKRRRGPWIEDWYDEGHRAERAKYADVIRSHGGICMEKVCIKPSRRIEAGAFWHLGHDHERGGQRDYVGPVHPECNRHEAEQRGVVFVDDEYNDTYAEPDDDRDLGTHESDDPWATPTPQVPNDPWAAPATEVPNETSATPKTLTPKVSRADDCMGFFPGCKPGRCNCPGGYDEDLFEQLRTWRSLKAAGEGVPTYAVFTDRTLQLIAEQKPRSADALLRIEGIGKSKIERYGDAVLALID